MTLFFKRFISLTALCFVTLTLTGCFWWWSSDNADITVQYDGITVVIPQEYQEVPSSLVENKQILNKVIKSFKLIEDEGYIDNIVITKSLIAESIDSAKFATANLDKLQENIIGFTPGQQTIDTVKCWENSSVETLRHSFSIKDSFYDNATEYFVDQFQFVYNGNWYIISSASDLSEKKITKAFTKILKTFACAPLSSPVSDE